MSLRHRRYGKDQHLVMLGRGKAYLVANDIALAIMVEGDKGTDDRTLSRKLATDFAVTEEQASGWVSEARELLLEQDTMESDHLDLERPVLVQWRVTKRCNLNCRHCYVQPAGRSPEDEMTPDQRKLVASRLVDEEVFAVTITGGEPFLLPDTPALVRRLCSSDIFVKLFTNGLLARRHLALLSDLRHSLGVDVSLDGDRKAHELIRGPGTYAPTVEVIGSLIKAGVSTTVNIVLNKINYATAFDVAAMSSELGVDSVQFSYMSPGGNARGNLDELYLTPEDYQRFSDLMRGKATAYGKRTRIYYSVRPSEGVPDSVFRIDETGNTLEFRDTWRCCAGRTRLTVDADGEMFPCPFFGGRFALGNAVSTSLGKAWAAPNRLAFIDFVSKTSRTRYCAALRAMTNPELMASMSSAVGGCEDNG